MIRINSSIRVVTRRSEQCDDPSPIKRTKVVGVNTGDCSAPARLRRLRYYPTKSTADPCTNGHLFSLTSLQRINVRKIERRRYRVYIKKCFPTDRLFHNARVPLHEYKYPSDWNESSDGLFSRTTQQHEIQPQLTHSSDLYYPVTLVHGLQMESKYILVALVAIISGVSCSDITSAVFGTVLDGMPAAFGDFNSDELTDVFVLRKEGKTLEILLAAEQEPLLQPNENLSCTFTNVVTSVVPGDFDGDVFMDVLVTTISPNKVMNAYILWGGNGQMNCTDEMKPLVQMHGQPLTVDYNQDMIIDLFGLNLEDRRTFWIFNRNRTAPEEILMERPRELHSLLPIRKPHANAFLDLNGDFLPDLVVTTDRYFEVWRGIRNGFVFNHTIELPYNETEGKRFGGHIGQSLFLDVELTGKIELVLPVCEDSECLRSAIMIHSDGAWHKLQINFHDNTHENVLWGFVSPSDIKSRLYTDTITLRGGDFNMDGYPDLLATLRSANAQIRSFLLLNSECTNNCGNFNRTFEIQWNALSPFNNESVMAVFYDFYQDGILDVILVEFDKDKYRTAAFKNSLDYDANFVKVMVLTGLTNSKYPISPGTLGRKKRTYGTNLPGPSIAYKTTTQDGSPRSAIAAQLPQSAHFSLNLPYTTFGLGRTPNFINTLTIGVSGKLREWTQIIPNSQMVVIPNPISEPSRWKAQLFVTPSKLILLSVAALTSTCCLIAAIIVGLYWKERREDKIERLQEAHRFHFDAM